MSVVRRFGVLALGVIVLVVGIVAQVAIVRTASFGWTAYAPLSSVTFTPSVAPILPLIEIGVGAVLIAAWVGYRLGRRAPRGSGPTSGSD
jgi:heme/copper-type cytochrome/quinol oxidase subunit 1